MNIYTKLITICTLALLHTLSKSVYAQVVPLDKHNLPPAIPIAKQSSKQASHVQEISPPKCTSQRGTKALHVNGANTHYPQDGKSWKTAFCSLEKALEVARYNFEISTIKIACGVYKPTNTYSPVDELGNLVTAGTFSLPEFNPGITNDEQLLNYADNPNFYNRKLITFQLVDGVDLIGGYKVNDCHGSSSDKCQTVLDGNLGTDENPDRVWHVLIAGNDLLHTGVSCNLKNLTIQNGDAAEAPYFPVNFFLDPGQIPVYYHDDGAGLYVVCKSFINFYNVTVKNSKAIAGSAVYADDGSILNFYNCTFSKNTGFDGAAVMIRNGGQHELTDFDKRTSTAFFEHCTFHKNNGSNFGTVGAYDNYGIDPALGGPNVKLVKCKFSDRTPFGTIATIMAHLHLVDCEIDNSGFEGGMGLFLAYPTFTQLWGCTIKNCYNNNNFPGGALSVVQPLLLYNWLDVHHCTFKDNTTVNADGGAIALLAGDIPIYGNIADNEFRNNTATNRGGAMYLSDNSIVTNNNWPDNKFRHNKAQEGNNIFAEPGAYLPQK